MIKDHNTFVVLQLSLVLFSVQGSVHVFYVQQADPMHGATASKLIQCREPQQADLMHGVTAR